MAFKRLTQPQRDALHALKVLGGEMMVTPQDARSLGVLKRRVLNEEALLAHCATLPNWEDA